MIFLSDSVVSSWSCGDQSCLWESSHCLWQIWEGNVQRPLFLSAVWLLTITIFSLNTVPVLWGSSFPEAKKPFFPGSSLYWADVWWLNYSLVRLACIMYSCTRTSIILSGSLFLLQQEISLMWGWGFSYLQLILILSLCCYASFWCPVFHCSAVFRCSSLGTYHKVVWIWSFFHLEGEIENFSIHPSCIFF